jgi:predicted membrane protein
MCFYSFLYVKKGLLKEIKASSYIYQIIKVLFIQSQIQRLLSLKDNYIALDRPFYALIASVLNTQNILLINPLLVVTSS